MMLPRLIATLSIIVWLFPPIRQFKGKFFFYFLILALLDPLLELIHLFIHLNPIEFYSIGNLLLIISLLSFSKLQKYMGYLILITIITTWLSFSLGIREVIMIIILEHLVILIFLLRVTLLDINDNRHINLFYIILDFYILSIIFKFFGTLIDLRFSLFYFYITSAFEILIGTFFILYNEKNSPKVKLRFKN